MNPSKAWNAKLEASSFFCHLKTYTTSVEYKLNQCEMCNLKLYNKSKLWVTGGIGQNHLQLNTTELIDIEHGMSTKGVQLPINLQLHCLIKINENQVLLTGGLR